MAKISGKWKWNEIVHCSWFEYVIHRVNFFSNGEEFNNMFCFWSVGVHNFYYGYHANAINVGLSKQPGDDFFTIKEEYRVMDFGDEQEIDDELYAFIVANAIPYKTVAEKLTIIAENQQKVYDAGYNKAMSMGDYPEGFEDGKKAEYDMFWDAYQQNGKRNNYQYGAFGGEGWTDETYKPKYPVKVTYGYGMYTGCNMTEIKDVDFSKAYNLLQVFNVSYSLQKIGVINAPICQDMGTCFSNCRALHTIEEIIVGEQCTFVNCFNYCYELQNITFECVIANDIDLHWSTKLTETSIRNIIEHLSWEVSLPDHRTVTLSKKAVDDAFRGDLVYDAELDNTVWDETIDGSLTQAWADLEASVPLWTITLI